MIATGHLAARGEAAQYDGRVIGVNDEGQLVLRDSFGRRHVVLTEEIRALD